MDAPIQAVPSTPLVSVIIPARDEEECLADCLQSLVTQSSVRFEVIVVDDSSRDRTPWIARSFDGVRVLDAGPLPAGWCGKSWAAWVGARQARGRWLLFTDADTIHLPGSLRHAVDEAQSEGASLLSYSPKQQVDGLLLKAVMPLVFADLKKHYPPSRVNLSGSLAAANGQYLMISRHAYDAVGEHAAVAGEVLEDVALAQAVKRLGGKLSFRFGGEAVEARMYRSFAKMWAGWTKNLARLFPSPLALASIRALEFLLMAGGIVIAAAAGLHHDEKLAVFAMAASVLVIAQFGRRIRQAHFAWDANLAAVLGLPLFALLLVHSYIHYRLFRKVTWKRREYRVTIEPALDHGNSNLSPARGWLKI
jgi:Glycosyl transferase family 2